MTVVAQSPQGLSLALSYWLALVVLIVLLVLLAFAAGAAKKRIQGQQGNADGQKEPHAFWYVILGADNRVSTSKVQFALWTLALAYALLVIAFHDAVYPPGSLDPRYLLLIGFPAGAAVTAKAITTGQINSGSSSKTVAPFTKKGMGTAISEIVSNDQGDLDLGDAQYFIFNLVALTAFFIAFFHDPVSLPVLPDTLVGLTSASAAAYVAKKATVPAAPAPPMKVTAVSPQIASTGTRVNVFGSGFVNTASSDGGSLFVTMGGLAATVLGNWTATMVTVTVPAGLPESAVNVQVTASDGRTDTLPNAFQAAQAPQVPAQRG